MNVIFFGLVAISFGVAGFRQITWVSPGDDAMAPMEALGLAIIKSAEASVTLALGLIGVMALFLGLMKVAEEGGLLVVIARLVRPLMVRLFPDVPPDHPAMGAMILNMSANVLGLGNAATPFGIRAMQELDKLNEHKGTATNAMAMFLAINTSSVTLLPTGVIALRASVGSADPAGILPTTLFATICSTTVAIISAKLLQRYWAVDGGAGAAGAIEVSAEPPFEAPDAPPPAPPAAVSLEGGGAGISEAYPAWVSFTVLGTIIVLVPLTVIFGGKISPWIIPGLMVGLLGYGVSRRVRVYECFVDGARDGFQVALRIIPYLVAILVAVAMFRESGAMEMLIRPISLVTAPLGLPGEALPMALMRPLSGSGAFGLLASLISDKAIGPDSYTGYLVSTFQGSTETTFFVLAVYFGSVQVRRVRHALAAGLAADVAGVIGAVVAVTVLYG